MEPFRNIVSKAIPLPIENIDTDQIIPARYLKAVRRVNFGNNLFYDWRFNGNDEPNNDFILNNPIFGGKILIAGKNFGCGSSREHAAWALYDYGFRVIISSSFADIFKSNALNNGLLTIQLPEETIRFFMNLALLKPQTKFTVDLQDQSIGVDEQNYTAQFKINGFSKECLLKGFDSIDYLISLRNKTEMYEQNRACKLEYSF